MAVKKGRDYFKFGGLLSLILAIIPVTSWVLGVIIRFKEGHWVCGLVRVFLGGWILWLLDLISMILKGRIVRLF